MNKKAEEITGLKRSLVLHKQASSSLAYLPLLQCLKSKEKIEPKVIRINGVNVGVTVVPVLRKDDCIGAFAILQRFNDAENRQHELRNQLMHKATGPSMVLMMWWGYPKALRGPNRYSGAWR